VLVRPLAVGFLLAIAGCTLATSLDGLSGGAERDAAAPDVAVVVDASDAAFADADASVDAPSLDPLSQGLSAWWRFDEGAGTKANDSSGNGNHGTLTNGVAWAAGIDGGALSFDGIDDYVRAEESTSLAATDTMSVTFWINPNTATFAGQGRVVSHPPAWDIKLNGDNPQLSAGGRYCIGSVGLVAGTWQHVAVVFERGRVGFFVDGVAQKVGTNTFQGGESLGAGESGMFLGSAGGNASFTNGKLADVRIYDRVLTSDEIGTLARR
jgi:hypothetical protein